MAGSTGKILLAYLGFFVWGMLRNSGAITQLPTTKLCLNTAPCVHCFQQPHPNVEQLSVTMEKPGKLISIPKCQAHRYKCEQLLQLLALANSQSISLEPIDETKLFLEELKASMSSVPLSYSLSGDYQWAALTPTFHDLKVQYRHNDVLSQLKMFSEVIGWSTLLLAVAFIYNRNAGSSAVSVLTLMVMVIYLFDIYSYDPEAKHLNFYSSLAGAAFIYVVVRHIPINHVIATILMLLSLGTDYARLNGYPFDSTLLIFVAIVVVVTLIGALVKLDRLSRTSAIAVIGLLLYQLSQLASAMYIQEVNLINGLLTSLALNVTPLLLLAQRQQRSQRAQAKAAGRPYKAPDAEQQMEEVEDAQGLQEVQSPDQEGAVEMDRPRPVARKPAQPKA